MPDTRTDPDPSKDGRQENAEREGDAKDHGDTAPVPFAPHEDDDTPLGDTDQHSDA